MAVSSAVMAAVAPAAVAPEMSSAATAVSVADRSLEFTVMVSCDVVPAPTWKAKVALVPFKSTWLLNLVPEVSRVTSACSAENSVCRFVRSPELLVPLADCTANSRMRCKESPILPVAPSAVCAKEMASLALRMATFMPFTWAFMRSEMASPAASSLALLTRKPEDRRCIAMLRADCEADTLRCAVIELMFVLMV